MGIGISSHYGKVLMQSIVSVVSVISLHGGLVITALTVEQRWMRWKNDLW